MRLHLYMRTEDAQVARNHDINSADVHLSFQEFLGHIEGKEESTDEDLFAWVLVQTAQSKNGMYANLFETKGGFSDLATLVQSLQAAGMTPHHMQRLIHFLDKTPGQERLAYKAKEIADFYHHFLTLLKTQGNSAAQNIQQRIQKLRKQTLPLLQNISSVEVHGLVDFFQKGALTLCATLQILAALGGSLHAKPVYIQMPEPDPTLEMALRPLLQALFYFHDADLNETHVPFLPRTKPCRVYKPLTGMEEARLVAQKVQQFLAEGVAEESIGIVAQTEIGRQRLASMLKAYHVPVVVSAKSSKATPKQQAFFALCENQPGNSHQKKVVNFFHEIKELSLQMSLWPWHASLQVHAQKMQQIASRFDIWSSFEVSFQSLLSIWAKQSSSVIGTRAAFVKTILNVWAWKENKIHVLSNESVLIADAETMLAHHPSHMLVTGFIANEWPTELVENRFLSDTEKIQLNQLLEQPVFETSQDKMQMFSMTLAQLLSRPCHLELFVPRLNEQLRPTQAHRALQSLPHVVEEMPILQKVLTPERVARAHALAEIEKQRLAWFASRNYSHPGNCDGVLVSQRVQLPKFDNAHQALAISALNDYAQCPYRFFLRHILHIQETPEEADGLPRWLQGRLAHEMLHRFFLHRKQKQRLPLQGDASDIHALQQACKDTLAANQVETMDGNKYLISMQINAIIQELQDLIQKEAIHPPHPKLIPTWFEHVVGPFAIPSPDPAQASLYVQGRIDRVDVGEGEALILDYKRGNLARYEALLRETPISTFQLPLYVWGLKQDAAFQAQEGPVSIQAKYYSLSQASVSIGAVDENTAHPAEVYRLGQRIHQGDFQVNPKSCVGCTFGAICRIDRPVL